MMVFVALPDGNRGFHQSVYQCRPTVSVGCGGLETCWDSRVTLDGGCFRQGFFSGMLVRFGFSREIGGDEELRDFLRLRGEGAERFARGHEVDAGGAKILSGADGTLVAALESDEDGFDMLAGVEAVDAEIRASAGEAA